MYVYCGQSNFEFEYLGEFETEFENILGFKSGAQVCSFDGKKRRSKISCYCPFKDSLGWAKSLDGIGHGGPHNEVKGQGRLSYIFRKKDKSD